MKIICTNQEEFFETIAQLTQRGLGFRAYFESLTVELTGGF